MIARSRNAFEDRGERFRLVAQTIPSGSAGRFRLANTSQNHLCLVMMMMLVMMVMMMMMVASGKHISDCEHGTLQDAIGMEEQ